MSRGLSVRYLTLLELVSNPSAMLFVCEIVDVLYLEKRQLVHIVTTGQASKLLIFFH